MSNISADRGLLPSGSKVTIDHNSIKDSGNSSDMNIDGSVTPVNFEYGPPAGEVWFLSAISFIIDDNGTLDGEDFGSIVGGLPSGGSNGLKVILRLDSSNNTLTNIRTNNEIATFFLDSTYAGDQAGFLNSKTAFIGKLKIDPFVTRNGDDGDLLRVTVQNDLSGVMKLSMSATAWRII